MSRTPKAPQRLLAFTCWLGLTVGSTADKVKAHAAPEARQLLFDDADEPRWIVSNRGLLLRSRAPEPASFRLMCNEALGAGVSTSHPPEVVLLPDGELLAATQSGLWSSSDGACSWERRSDLNASSLAQSATDARQLWMTATSDERAGVYTSTDAGRSWQPRVLRPGESVRDVKLAASDAARVYAVVSRVRESALEHRVLRSRDGGVSWDELALELLTGETQPALLGVSPRDPELLFARAESDTPATQRDRLLVSIDGAKSFRSPLSLYAISGVAWSEDGTRVWVSSEEGLYLSTDRAQSFERVGQADVLSCVSQRAGKLYACGLYAGIGAQRDGIGVSDDEGASFQPWLAFEDVKEPVDCAQASPTSERCAQPWSDWARELLGATTPTAAQGAASGGQSSAAPATRAASGCSALSNPPRVAEQARAVPWPRRAPWILLSLLCLARLRRAYRDSSNARRRRNSRVPSASGATPETLRTASPNKASPSSAMPKSCTSNKVSS